MSTFRDISTLPLDALRSTAYSAERTARKSLFSARETDTGESVVGATLLSSAAMPHTGRSSILATNEKLYDENRQLRRCLSLILDNSQLRTVSVLSSVMSMCDDKLRNFITGYIIKALRALMCRWSRWEYKHILKEVEEENIDAADVVNREKLTYDPSSEKTPTKGHTSQSFKQSNNDRVSSQSYGKSFATLGLNDLGNSTVGASSNSYSKATSPRKGYSPASTATSFRPPMKFGYGSSPYQPSPTKQTTGQSFSTPPNRSDEYRYQSKLRSRSRSQSRNNYSVRINTKETHTQVKNPVVKFSDPSSVPRRTLSAPASPRAFTTQVVDFPVNTSFEERDSRAVQAINSVRHCRGCGINLLPVCSCQSPRTADETIPTTNTPTYINERPDLTSSTQGGSTYEKSDVTGTVFKTHLSKTIRSNFTRAPNEKTRQSQPDDDYVMEEFRREKKHYERILPLANERDARSTQTTSVESGPRDGSLTTDDIGNTNTDDTDGTSLDINPPDDLYIDGPQYTTPARKTPEEQTGNYGRLGTPLAASTPKQSPAKNTTAFRDSTRLPADSMAHIMGFTGRGSREKVNYVLHRPVDVLIGYTPDISEEASLSLAFSEPNKRIVGEIAFQLDRRILEFVFGRTSDKNGSKRRSRYYGYSVASIMLLIQKEVRHAGNDPATERSLRVRLELIQETLIRFGYELERHAEFTQDMVNKYGLLNGSPNPDTAEGFGLSEPAVLRILLGQVLRDPHELDDMLIILDCLHYMTFKDKRPLFIW